MYQPVQQWKSQVWRAARALQGKPTEFTPLDRRDAAGREQFYEKGRQQVASLAERIEAKTGFTIDSRRVLDYGCGAGRTALAFAERCEHVYGLDTSPAVLREADATAKSLNIGNVEWLEAARVAELEGQYDLVVSFFVFQHIRSRHGERIFATLVRGLRPGGAGALQVTLRPPRFRGRGRKYLYHLVNSYSLNRLAKILAELGVTEWHVTVHATPGTRASEKHYEDATIIFRKD